MAAFAVNNCETCFEHMALLGAPAAACACGGAAQHIYIQLHWPYCQRRLWTVLHSLKKSPYNFAALALQVHLCKSR
jgi:hypothetical protein